MLSIKSIMEVEVLRERELVWTEHITYISSKISRGMWMLIKARKYLKDAMIALYASFVFPYLKYCNYIWGSTCKSKLSRLCALQNKIVRIIFMWSLDKAPKFISSSWYNAPLAYQQISHWSLYVPILHSALVEFHIFFSNFFKTNSEFHE